MSTVIAAAGSPLGAADRAWVKDATAYSAYAGPDSQQVWLTEACALGHGLLSTSPHEGPQPATLDSKVWLSGDVRLDGRDDLRRALRQVGSDATDEDLVLHAYAAWSDGFLDHLAGDFAFALWDGRTRRLVCARDQLGVAQLHYARVGERLLVASVPDALLLHPEVGDELDESALADFLIRGNYEDQEATAFKAVRRIAPGHVLTWSDGSLRLRRYWQMPQWEPLARFARPDDYVERFRELLDTAVADRVTGDRLAVHLSGGMDSTSVAASAKLALVARGAPLDALRAMTMTLDPASGDREGEYAALVARSLGLEVDFVEGDSFQALDPFAEPPLLTPEPTRYRRTETEYQFAAVPARHARAALSGVGGDPLVWFIPWYWAEWLVHGRVLRVARAFSESVRLFRRRPRPYVRVSVAQVLERRRRAETAMAPAWLAPEFAARTEAAARAKRFARAPARRYDARALAYDPMWAWLFRAGDPSFSRLPLKFRYPLIDLRLVGYALRLPPDPWFVRKRILRDAAAGRLPEEIRQRRKTPLRPGPTPGASPAAMQRLAAFVRESPEVERFFERDQLAAALVAPGAATDRTSDRLLALALGLVHWLHHRRQPRVENSDQISRIADTHAYDEAPPSTLRRTDQHGSR